MKNIKLVEKSIRNLQTELVCLQQLIAAEEHGVAALQSGEAPSQQLKTKISAWRIELASVGADGLTRSHFDKICAEMLSAETSAI